MIDKRAVVKSAIVDNDVEISPFVFISENVKIGKGVVIHPHVTIMDGVIIGDGVEIFPGAYIGKKPKGKALDTHNVFVEKVSIGRGSTIGTNAVIYYGDIIGEENMIGDGVSIRENVIIGKHCIIGRNSTINYGSKIGNYVKIMDLSHITARVVIHDEVFIGPHVCMADDNGFGKDAILSANSGGAEIFENVNIGEGAKLLPNVKIGKNAVVAAGAVVTKNIDEGMTVMGVPAKIVLR